MIDERDDTEVADLEAEYELLNELGRGGSAVVWRARDRSLGREVAIKVVHTRTAGANDDAIARLAREARTVAKLQHPNIVTVYAVKRLREGGLALVMQLVPGRTLKQAVAESGAFSAEEAERVIRDVAQALAYAHSHGVVHRDVKPENIFIDETNGRAMLSDFGIAYSSEFDSRLTMTGAAIGTPAYMSPEQIDGAPANARSDVYSLGLVAWEMLTGERPWEGETLYNVIFKQKHEELPTIDELRPNAIPARLQYIVERMLQKKPAARWAGAEGLLTILTAWVVPGDWRQWEEAHQRRRELVKAASKGKAPTPTSVATASSQATVRFPRPRTPASEQVVIPTNLEQGGPLTPVATPAEDEDDDAPSWASTPIKATHGWRNTGIGFAVLFVAGLFAAYAWSSGRLQFPATWSGSNADAPRTIPIAALPPAIDSLTDSLNRVKADSAALAVGTSTRADSVGRADSIARASLTATALNASKLLGQNVSPAGVVVAPAVRAPVAPSIGVAATKPTVIDVTPTVRSSEDRATVAAGARHSCVVAQSGVYCWGANDRGQLGNGESESRDTPDVLNADIDLTQVVAGYGHSCGLTKSGDAYCWGDNERGQLGDATTTSRSAPVRVASNLSFQMVRAGQRHTCALTNGGDVACWGFNEKGQVGDGTVNNRSSPVIVKAPVKFISVSAGWGHTCAISFDGAAYCWGDNAAGQLGDGTHNPHRTPEPVASALKFTSISAGNTHTCAITDGGEAFCWGRNDSGQLGAGGSANSDAPIRVETPVRFASVTVGSAHSCGRTRSGQAWCWGRNTYGQLGDGSTTNASQPVRVAGPMSFASLNATGAHTCGTTADGETWCWGYNSFGQLGDGTRANHPRAVRVTMPAR